MAVTPLQKQDYWVVNSYGYPNPFRQESKSQEAWITFKSFHDHDNGTYTALKSFWESHLLLYRFLYSATRDLGDYFWWTELERVLCRVFSTSEASAAIQAIHDIRDDPSRLADLSLPADRRKGKFYNSLNQVVVHAGM